MFVTTMKTNVSHFSCFFRSHVLFHPPLVKRRIEICLSVVPVGFALGNPINHLIGMILRATRIFFRFYPSDLSAINFDRTGTTHIGKYLLNHSFMIPGLIGVGSATIVGYIIGAFFLKL